MERILFDAIWGNLEFDWCIPKLEYKFWAATVYNRPLSLYVLELAPPKVKRKDYLEILQWMGLLYKNQCHNVMFTRYDFIPFDGQSFVSV